MVALTAVASKIRGAGATSSELVVRKFEIEIPTPIGQIVHTDSAWWHLFAVVVMVIVFLMLRLTPGDPAANIAGDAAPEAINELWRQADFRNKHQRLFALLQLLCD